MRSLEDPRCKHEILTRIGNLRHDAPRRWGKMNVRQMICHVNDSFLGVIGERPISIISRYRGRKLVKWLALYAPVQWPKGIPTRPEVDAEFGGTPPADFEVDKAALISLIDRFTAQPRAYQFEPHPIFLGMSERQWMRWGYLHVDHHLRQFGA